ncbi:alpha/beta-hydrolase [Linderina pennispora]|uniref:Carboxypeptidase n=1 Tax=Linderina pennispora TaxID=61395 RepID=A0A1Y1VY59_9FUNG|nr:alpha/beta-hydrolase [Linderina pennispora]ORX66210.1 alpha/beta-hydrolase [Linderina pennispora]
MDAIPNYRLRVKNPGLCDTSVEPDKHFFFWFFEARKVKHEDAPLILWLNGGPGLQFGGNGTDHNPFSWNDRAHIIFLDQPTNVGFSYWDVNALLQLFYKSFPQYANSELHVFGESYGGHYVPAVGKAIHEANRELESKRNPYDVRRYCVGNGLCYEIEDDIDTYLNNAGVQKALGAEVKKFESCSEKVGTGIFPPLLADNIRVLIYAGDADFTCNWYGNKAWSMELDYGWWTGVGAGEVRTHENFTFLRVFGAGHMVPYDKPKESLDMINRWLDRKPY